MAGVFRGTISIGVIFIGQGVGDKVKYRTSPMSVADSRARARVQMHDDCIRVCEN